jgi:hypothetical protein
MEGILLEDLRIEIGEGYRRAGHADVDAGDKTGQWTEPQKDPLASYALACGHLTRLFQKTGSNELGHEIGDRALVETRRFGDLNPGDLPPVPDDAQDSHLVRFSNQ